MKRASARLSNGITIHAIRDSRFPIASLAVGYPIGSVDDPTSASGCAHLIEHMMFEGSPTFPPGEHRRIVNSLGGRSNAATSFLSTICSSVAPSAALPTLLDLEADRMSTLSGLDDAATIERQKDIVVNEIGGRERAPYGDWQRLLLNAMFPSGHPLHNPAGGAVEEIQALTPSRLREFWNGLYGPAGSQVVVVGDCDAERVLEQAYAAFARIPQSRSPAVGRDRNSSPRVVANPVAYGGRAPAPRIYVAYQVEPASADALERIVALASIGSDSSLSRELIYERRAAVAVGGTSWMLKDSGLIVFWAAPRAAGDVDATEQAMVEILENLSTSATQRELDRARVVAHATRLRENASVRRRAVAVCDGLLDARHERSATATEIRDLLSAIQPQVRCVLRYEAAT